MNDKSALDRLGNTVSEHHHRHKKSNCRFGKVLQGENTSRKYNYGAVKYDEHNSIPVVEYFAPSLETLAIHKQGIVCVNFRGCPEKEGAHAKQTWDHEPYARGVWEKFVNPQYAPLS